MKWEKIENKQVAQGEHGSFVIKKYVGFYYATYYGKTHTKSFNLPRNKSLKELKQICKNNHYWEA